MRNILAFLVLFSASFGCVQKSEPKTLIPVGRPVVITSADARAEIPAPTDADRNMMWAVLECLYEPHGDCAILADTWAALAMSGHQIQLCAAWGPNGQQPRTSCVAVAAKMLNGPPPQPEQPQSEPVAGAPK